MLSRIIIIFIVVFNLSSGFTRGGGGSGFGGGRGIRRGGRGGGGRGRGGRQPAPTLEELDKDLDSYKQVNKKIFCEIKVYHDYIFIIIVN